MFSQPRAFKISFFSAASFCSALSITAIAAFASAPAAAAGLDGLAPRVELKVFDEKTGKLLFFGKEQNSMDAGIISRVTTYTDTKGKKLQEERVKYNANTLRIVSQSSRNFVTGTKVDMSPLKVAAEGETAVALKFQERSGSDTKTKELASDNLYVGNVMHHIVLRNWQKLTEQNKKVVVKLIAPTRLDYYSFRLSSRKPAAQDDKVKKTVVKKKTAPDGSSSTVVTTTETKTLGKTNVIVLEPDSWLIRSLVDPMEFFYENGKLKEFRGITPVVIDDNPYRRTRFQFSYPSS